MAWAEDGTWVSEGGGAWGDPNATPSGGGGTWGQPQQAPQYPSYTQTSSKQLPASTDLMTSLAGQPTTQGGQGSQPSTSGSQQPQQQSSGVQPSAGNPFTGGTDQSTMAFNAAENSTLQKAALASANQVAQTATLPAFQANNYKQARFNTVFPWLQTQLGSLASQTAGGQSPASPEITVGGVLNPQQIQQQVNTTRATNDQGMQSQNRQQAQTTAGQGFGANSPLLQALQGANANANLGTNAAAETQLRLGAAQQNAGQLLNTQQARETQFANRQQEQIARTKPIWGAYSALLGSLGGLV